MRIVLVIITVVLVILAIFTAANWSVLTIPTPLSFVAFSVEGPLGVILLGVTLGLTLLMVAYALLLRTSWLVESRRFNHRLEEQRELAEKAESSRIIALQELLEQEFEDMKTSLQTLSASGLARIESAEKALIKTIEENSNGIVAQIGYIDDRIKGGSESSNT
ncbi:MAG: hypothetical protein CVT49_13010 [candidate division Zixibacteria bacterium HGW-Zixibacteria-1]|nr:MAG: hypothetical protein CVT49_13010 [candidate division Zixibacteria bacterium HGW-Zixibacteria-1]